MAPPKRRRPSTVDRLDPEIRSLIAKLRIDDGWTIDEILKKLRAIGQGDVSRSALGRHVKSIEDIGAELRHSTEIANSLVAQLGDAPEDRTAQLNIQLMQSLVFRAMTSITDEEGDPVAFGPKELGLLSKTLQQLAGAQKTNQEAILKIREQARLEAATENKKKLEAAGRDGRMDPDALVRAKRILGYD